VIPAGTKPAFAPRRASAGGAKRVAGAAILAGLTLLALATALVAVLFRLHLPAARAGQSGVAVPVALAGRLGDRVDGFDRRLAATAPAVAGPPDEAARRIYAVDGARLLVDVLPNGRVRQIAAGRERTVQETWLADEADWSLDDARLVAGRWLPADAALVRQEPFLFQGRAAGQRDIYFSPSLAAVPPADYAAARAGGPPGACVATYYQTEGGGIAFLLVGLY
jgi:hypothetical protein